MIKPISVGDAMSAAFVTVMERGTVLCRVVITPSSPLPTVLLLRYGSDCITLDDKISEAHCLLLLIRGRLLLLYQTC